MLLEGWMLTRPLIGYYRERGVLKEIDGRRGVDEVTAAIESACRPQV